MILETKNKEILVVLKPWQRAYVNFVGDARARSNRSVGRADNRTIGFKGSVVDRQGTAGEFVVSLYTGLPWTNRLVHGSKVNGLNHDVGDDIEVRTALKATHRLAMHRNDDPDLRYVLVLAHRNPVYVIAGWLWGHEIAVPHRWHPELPYPAWLAPQVALRDPRELRC